MRQVVLDTETTGLEHTQGHRIIEIGCVEMVDRKLTGRTYHQYVNPERQIDDGAMEVHGITNEFLADKPPFLSIASEFVEFISGAELVIHNAPFDVGFMDSEFKLGGREFSPTATFCTVLDTLVLARAKHPGQKNSLDALCKRYGVNNDHRDLHGALLDSEILADVYLAMTGGQTTLSLAGENDGLVGGEAIRRIAGEKGGLKIVRANASELTEHDARIKGLNEATDGGCVWLQ
ncbi:MAG: DNA polymerase III subunit epsilon [Pseudomonadales bacterium]|nr:DNA polymerase III subunit epsilon [Pseudomonadales bacterium]